MNVARAMEPRKERANMLCLKGHWYIAAPSLELGRRPIRRSLEGEPLVLFRDSDGHPHALVDRCAHRGMALSQGRVVGGCLQCPYHGWKYDGMGCLREVPALTPGAPIPQAKSMQAYPVVEQDEHLWVWWSSGVPPAPPFRFPHSGEEGWSRFFMHTRFEAPVEACLENFLDVPHTIFVHPGLFRGDRQRETRARVRRFRDSVVAEFLDEAKLEGFGPRLVFPKGTAMRHTDQFILPSISRVDYLLGEEHGFVITSQCTQREEYVIDVTTAISWRLPVPRWIARAYLKRYCRKVIRQDVDILKIHGDQIRRFGPCAVNTSADLLGRHISALRRWSAEGHAGPEVSLEETILRI